MKWIFFLFFEIKFWELKLNEQDLEFVSASTKPFFA
jgi:hypothetical protein